MCLEIKKDQQPLTAEADISCYKVVIYEERYYNVEYKTYFKKAIIKLGSTYKSKLERNTKYDTYVDSVEMGLHSFIDLESAIDFIDNGNNFYELRVIKCLIPKGSIYYSGSFGYWDSYASTALKYLEVVDIDLN